MRAVGNMAQMRWWIPLVLALAVLAALPAQASAKVPCRNQIFNDWEHDGQIASTYPLACYRDALRHVPTTEQIYSSLQDDIRAALQAAIARSHGKKVADQVGHKFTPLPATTSDVVPVLVDRRSMKDERTNPTDPATVTNASQPLTAAASSGGGVPTPLVVLGAVALVLVASGAVGLAVRGRRS